MLGINRWWQIWRSLVSSVMVAVLVLSLVSCGDRAETSQIPNSTEKSKIQIGGAISEVSPPEAIQQLQPTLDIYKPQVSILSPKSDEVLPDTKVTARFQVQDLPIFKNPDLGMGPHLEVILDNHPYTMVYDLNQPLVLQDLDPGTHTLQVFAARPWHESFKNEGAYAQTRFHILTKTAENNPNPDLPLLTYSRPTGSYGAEPIMLDFYLTNAPLHLVAQENPEDEIADWRIRVTINGESFVLDRWQPLYLKGFKPGKNWVQLEFLDEQGNPVNNAFNNTVRLLTYEPKGKDAFAKLVRGEISAAEVRGIVDPNYKLIPKSTPTPTPTPSPIPTPTPTPSPAAIPKPEPSEPVVMPSIAPKAQETPIVEPEKPEVEAQTATSEEKVSQPEEATAPEVLTAPSPIVESSTADEPAIAPPQETRKLSKYNRYLEPFRRPASSQATPAPSPKSEPSPEVSEPSETPAENIPQLR